MSHKVAKVGVGIFIFKNGQFIMGRRRNAHGDGHWSIPGGHLEYGETFTQTAQREAYEETGLKIKNVRFGAVTNDYFKTDNKHYITVWMISDYASGQERMTEPDKFVDLQWREFNSLPKPLFLPWRQLLKSQFINQIKAELDKTVNWQTKILAIPWSCHDWT